MTYDDSYLPDVYRDEDEADVLFYGDPLLEIEAEHAMSKMDVPPSDPHYWFWRDKVEHDLQASRIQA